MSILIPSVGSTQYKQVRCTDSQTFADDVANALIAAGWSKTLVLPATGVFTINQPSNGWSLYIGGGIATCTTQLVYTFVTTLVNATPNQVLIGATQAASISNLVQAVNVGAGAGTLYSSATTANGLFTASLVSSSQFRLTSIALGPGPQNVYIVRGTSSMTYVESSGASNIGDGGPYNYLAGGGYQMTSAPTPQGLKMSLLIENWGQSFRFRAASPLLDMFSTTALGNSALFNIVGAACISVDDNPTRLYEFVCNAHQFWFWLAGDFDLDHYAHFMGGVPSLRPVNAPTTITSASNTTPVVIGTATAHGVNTGDNVFVCDVFGNTGANGVWQNVTVVDSTHIQLTGSVGTGTYTSGGLIASPSQIARAIWFQNNNLGTAAVSTFRATAFNPTVVSNGYSSQWHVINGTQIGNIASGAGQQSLNIPNPTAQLYGFSQMVLDPILCAPYPTHTAGQIQIGQLWDCFILTEGVPPERAATGFMGKNWVQFCCAAGLTNSLWIAKS